MNIHVARTPYFRTRFTHTCCQGQTGSLTVRPDTARWNMQAYNQDGDHIVRNSRVIIAIRKAVTKKSGARTIDPLLNELMRLCFINFINFYFI